MLSNHSRFFQCLPLICLSIASAKNVDHIHFGDEKLENSHHLKSELSNVVQGELGASARQLRSKETPDWRGGRVTFTMNVDPDRPNYFTVKLWGGDTAHKDIENRLCLFIDGKQVGQRHLGEVDFLDIMGHEIPRYPGRFLYRTLPLPEAMTKGKRTVELAIEGQGGINGYAPAIEEYQKKMTEPSRAIYAGYVHTETCFVPEATEVEGKPPAEFPLRASPGPEMLDALKTQLNATSSRLMEQSKPLGVDAIEYLATAYTTSWNAAHKQPKALERIAASLDVLYQNFKKDSRSVEGVRWIGTGPAANGFRIVFDDLAPYIAKTVEGTDVPRSQAWAEVFIASRNFHASRRRSLTNQSMILDMNLYANNLAASLLKSPKAWPMKSSRKLLYESVGLEPWSGNWDENAKPDWSQGKQKMLFTEKGLSRENGYVGGYGETIIDFAIMMYESTQPSPGAEGDPILRKRLIELTRARGVFRYPLVDADGNRSMNVETIIGWRDWHYPGGVMYDQNSGRDGGPFDAAITSNDPVLMGYGQQMIEDNQFFAGLQDRMGDKRITASTRLLTVPENYKKIAALPKSNSRLPMTKGQPDFVFADPTDGVIAVKNADEILFASLYWRSRGSINNLARVHYLTPTIERDATIRIKTLFNDSGKKFTVPDWTNQGFAKGRAEEFYRSQGMHLANAGEQQPIAKVPNDETSYKPGDENLYAGKGDYYEMTYGGYFVAMNCTKTRSFTAEVPERFRGGKELVSGKTAGAAKVELKPMQTVVIYIGK